MNETRARRLHREMREKLVEAVNINIKLLNEIGEKPTMVQIFGSISSDLHELLSEQRDKS